jgi:hypothetical protein
MRGVNIPFEDSTAAAERGSMTPIGMPCGCGSCSAPMYENAKRSVSASATTSPPAASRLGDTTTATSE